MPPIRSIAILVHHRHRDALSARSRIWMLASAWRARGIRVEVLHGIGRGTDADLLIPHLDVSYIPDDYWAFIQSHPRVVNRRLRDVRKRNLSTILVRPGDGYDGPVMIKTDGNCGGYPDQFHGGSGPGLPARARMRITRVPWIEPLVLPWALTLARYYVYDSPRRVPRGVWGNSRLVVERFVPEYRDGRYVLRQWVVFGSRDKWGMLLSTHPQVKSWTSTRVTGEPPPREIIEARCRLGLDFGKIDYVLNEGRGVLLDVNPTPTLRASAFSTGPVASEGLDEGLAYWEADDSPPREPDANLSDRKDRQ
ncbi:MAG: hypothetical protein IT437_00075 [Phycisphaerales bacterium]|nr:hypothetical protein [Phycisphaerales bacterium]